MDKPELITVTFDTWDNYTRRMIRMVEHFTKPDDIRCWTICDNHSPDASRLMQRTFKLPTVIVLGRENIRDLPRYNQLIEESRTEFIIAISTDVRLFQYDWVQRFLAPFQDRRVGMVGCPGPGKGMTPAHADPAVGGKWNWVPKMLVDRNIPFDHCEHVQSHCFAVRRKAFMEAGGFWIPEQDLFNKWNLIAGEVSLGPRLRAHGWKLNYDPPAMHHYGNRSKSEEQLDLYDRTMNWEIAF